MPSSKTAQSQYLLARHIIAHVFEQKFARGHHLVETGLAERFGVSRTLIRAALKRLAKESIVEPRRNQDISCSPWDRIDGRHLIPPSIKDDLYRRIVRDRIGGRSRSARRVALSERYGADRGVLLRVLETMADEGIVAKNKGHGWTFLPTISTETALRNSYDFRRVLEPSGILLPTFRPDVKALERLRAAHLALLARTDAASGPHLFDLDTEFHETIASFTGNAFFVQAIQQQNRLRRLIEYRGYTNRRRVRSWLREHLAIIDALKAGKVGRASQLMTRHLEMAHRATSLPSRRRVTASRRS